MSAGLADIEAGEEVGSLSGRGEHGRNATLKRRNSRCHHIIGRVLKPRIEISRFFKVEEPGHLLTVLIFERSTLNDWNLSRLSLSRTIAGLHAERAY